MSIGRILVSVEAEPQFDCLALAVALADDLKATLVGLGVEAMHMPMFAEPMLGSGLAIEAALRAEEDRTSAALRAAEARFRAATDRLPSGAEWRSGRNFPLYDVAAAARTADLIITSLAGRAHRSDHSIAPTAALVLQAGRPVLAAAPSLAQLDLGSVLVAWKDVREARRATADALPLLKRAGSVVVAEICRHGEKAQAEGRLADVVEYLASHEIIASARVCPDQEDVGGPRQLLELADELKAGLIVAGAYGHPRVQELVFGGFTRALLQQADRAVLLSH